MSDIYVVRDSQREWARAADTSRVARISLLNVQQMTFCMRHISGFFVFVVPQNVLTFVVHQLQTDVETKHEAAFSDSARSLAFCGVVFQLESKPWRAQAAWAHRSESTNKSTTNSGRSESAVPVRMHPQIHRV